MLSSALSGNQNGSATSTSLSSQLQSGQVQPPSSVQQQSTSVPQASNNGVAANPSRIDPSAKTKPGVLRFGPLPGEVDHNARLTPIAQGVSNLPGTTGPPIPPGTLPGTPGRGSNIGVASGLLSIQPTTAGTPDGKISSRKV